MRFHCMYEYLLQSDLTYLHTFVLDEIAISDLLLYGNNALQERKFMD